MDISNTIAFFPNLSPVQLLLVAFLILLLFGAKRLPELGRGLGKFLREFKQSTREIEEDIRSSLDVEPDEKSGQNNQKESPAPKAKQPDHTVERAEANTHS